MCVLCVCVCVTLPLHLYMCVAYNSIILINATGFWKTDQIVILDLFNIMLQLIAKIMHYPYKIPLPGLAKWPTF